MGIRNLFQRNRSEFDLEFETDNLVKSMAECKALHKKLILLAHPDKNPEKVALAEEITKLVNDNRRNYAKLKELKVRIENELL